MRNRRWTTSVGLMLVAVLLRVEAPRAQGPSDRLTALKAQADAARALADRLPANVRRTLSSGTRNLINVSERWDKLAPVLGAAATSGPRAARRGFGPAAPGPPAPGLTSVNDPGTDVDFSSFSGFTQSETSTAWCGNNVVTAYNDSGSFFETLFFTTGGFSFSGYARSTDRGGTFTDQGFTNPGPDPATFLAGDPVVSCADANTFYLANISDYTPFGGSARSTVSVLKSTSGGATFGDPVTAVSKDASKHLLDRDWMAVDPAHPDQVYVTYTDFDLAGSCPGHVFKSTIEIVRSTNGGGSWSGPMVLAKVCDNLAFVGGSQVNVGPSGEVYVMWEAFAADFLTRSIWVRKSTDGGKHFGAAVKIADADYSGDGELLQGGFRDILLPNMAIDRTNGATKGYVYVTWDDGLLQVGDAVSNSGFYDFADVVLSRSTDGGAHWSAPVRVNDNPDPVPGGFGTDQYQPAIAVDNAGTVGVCYYDRRNDPLNFKIDRYCTTVPAGTLSPAASVRVNSTSFGASIDADLFVVLTYMGDYDTLASDVTKANSGFVGAFGDNSAGNPDVKAVTFP